jgi:hypothetical protein
MPQTADELLDAVMRLSESDRLKIAARLLEVSSTDAPGLAGDDPGLADELHRRSGDHSGAVPWEELRDELRPSS